MLDHNRGWRIVEERLERTTDERHRAVLTALRDHLKAEATADFDLLVSTIAPEPIYRFWVEGSGFGEGPRGLDAVTDHYRTLYTEGRHVCQYDIERIVVDDDCAVTEGWFKQLYRAGVLASRGVEVDDPDAVYEVTMRLVLFWPVDDDARFIGEDSYSAGSMFAPANIRRVAPEEIPEIFHHTA